MARHYLSSRLFNRFTLILFWLFHSILVLVFSLFGPWVGGFAFLTLVVGIYQYSKLNIIYFEEETIFVKQLFGSTVHSEKINFPIKVQGGKFGGNYYIQTSIGKRYFIQSKRSNLQNLFSSSVLEDKSTVIYP